ncbi:MAG TPA: YdhR family protein [Burkholderiales bacterium]|nr:YdhR family protein [Burkholderiales bacterium]
MVTVIVNFPIPTGLSLEDFNAQMIKSVPKYQAMPGLVRKSYIVDAKNRVAGGAYSFASREHADACFSEDFIKGVTDTYGKPDIRFFDTLIEVDNQRQVVTR